MGVVYQARDTRLGRIVALKFLPQQWSHDEDAKQRFVREARAASATDHRNICTIHDIATADDGQLFIVMAYYEGQTLKQRLDSGALPIDEALDIATQIAEGLARAHAQGVVHRDIKPGNLILAEDGVRIVDFGLATFADALQLTIVGSTLGTAAYMSPEQVRGEAADARTDVWAVGVILYQMLTGHVPFRGAYAEAIAYAIRNETPGSIRAERPEVPEEVEQLVFRALHKEPGIRFPSGRELARALRQVRGQTLPMDLRTEPVPVAARLPSAPVPRRRLWRRVLVTAALVVVAALAGAAWMLAAEEREPVVIMPIVDLTGTEDLRPYRRALSQTIVLGLADSPTIRPVSWGRMLQTLRGFIARKTDISSREVMQALADAEGARLLVQPTFRSTNQQWYVQVELFAGATATSVASYESAPLPASALLKETAFRLTTEAMAMVEAHFRRGIRTWMPAAAPVLHVRTLDAARAFEAGTDLYEEQEYSAAHAAFQEAVTLDPRSPLAHAWRSRVLQVARRDDEAAAAAAQAMRLLSDGVRVSATDRLFVEAIDAEAKGELERAAARYTALVDAHPGDPLWLIEQAAFLDRQADTREEWEAAVRAYHDAIKADPSVIRPHLELCRLYNRLQDPESARKEGELALAAFEKSGWQGGTALSRLCLVDRFRGGDAADRAKAQEHAEAALQILRDIQFTYNLPRGLYYLGMAAAEGRRLSEARDLLEEADRTVQETGNRVFQPLVAGALSVVYSWLGDGPRAADGFARSSSGYERLGDERRAARQQYNAAAIRVQFGEGTAAAVVEIERLREVFEQRGDREFEAVAGELLGDSMRMAARYEQAETELLKALQLAGTHNLFRRASLIRTAQARLWFERAHYEQARARLVEIVAGESANATPEALMLLGRVQAKLGDFAAARASLARAGKALDAETDRQLASFLSLIRGEVAYEAGQFDEARGHFEKAVSFWTDSFTLGSALEARAYLGWLDALAGRQERAQAEIRASLARAKAMGRVAAEEMCRLLLARVEMLARRPRQALQILDGIPAQRRDALGLELRAAIHALRAEALASVDPAAAAADASASRELLDQIRAALPEASRAMFSARREIREMSGS
jgi:tetratricopeptide (TPR) repeat protein